ncbi:LPD1 domain-containing protein [Moraxella lincolnii]|uniref:LPD1 domain-containing protein n=1 Tax=Lwoffella lincolnii TaxID=90241 RepID=UPI00398425B1
MSNTDQNQKPEDFGEHIKGAKKETYFKAIDPTSEEAKSLPLSKLWKDKDIKAIEDRTLRAISFAIKDNLPNKPRNAIKLNRWLQNLQHQQDFVVRLIEANDPKHTQKALQNLQGTKVGSQAQLLARLDYDDYKKIQSVEFWQKHQSDNITFAVKIGGKSHEFSPKQAVTLNNYNPQAVIDEFVDDIKTIIKEQAQETGKKGMNANSFDIYTRRKDNTAFISAKTDRQKTPLIEFETLKKAREYLNDPENIAELGRRWTAHREQNSITKADMRNQTNKERTGQSYRDHDITPDEFMATFGVRGGQFGNWVTGDERQQMLNSAYDGLMDLAKTLNIEPKAIGLNGTLGIAFGARGSGSASAHYEAQEQVINLTKTRGAGSLAHEWWHALDHYMKNGDDLLTRHLNTNSTARHQELITPVRELIKGIHKSELYSRSQTADAYRSDAYFSTNVEMTARAFESYIQHALSKNGIKNDFLVNIKAEKDWQKNLDAYPYPKADELEQFTKAYTEVFDTLKEVDKEFAPVHYEPEQIIHADTLAITEADETKEKRTPIQESTATENETPQITQPISAPTTQIPQSKVSTPNISQHNTKLNTPYAEKDQAKALGAKWDNTNKSWYVPQGLDLNKFERWLVQDRQTPQNSPQRPQGQAIQPADRIYLYTQPSDNLAIQELKKQGIVKFDLPNKLWYADKANMDAVRQWATRPTVPTAEEALGDHLRSLGINVEAGHPIIDGKPHRLANDGSTDKNVMYHAYPNHGGVPYARITNFSRNGVSEWTYPTEHLLALRAIEAVERANGGHAPIQSSYTQKTATTPQITPTTQQAVEKAVEKNPEKIALENLMAQRAKMLMSFAPIAPDSQKYLNDKQVSANNIAHIIPSSDNIPEHLQAHIAIGNTPKQFYWLQHNNPENKLVLQRGNLVIPQMNEQGEIRAFETIAYNSRKYALKDAQKSGLSTTLGELKNGEPIILAEGYATGATLHENAGKKAVVISFGKNGLLDTAKSLRERYPDSKIYIGADNDHNKEVNVGLIDAKAVERTVPNSYVLLPQFSQGDTGKDWNDVFVDKGIDEFKRQLKEQLSVINPQQAIKPQDQERQPNQAVPTSPLDPDVIRQNFPTMGDDNMKMIQIWRVEIASRYANKPSHQELILERLTNKLPDYANGEILTPPKGYLDKQQAPQNITTEQPQHTPPTVQPVSNQINGSGR